MENDKKEKLEKIATAKREMSEAFWKLADILIVADAKEWAFYLDFDKKDLFSTFNIFWRTWSNHCIKNGTLTEENVEEKSRKFTEAIKECFGIDIVELTKELIKEKK